MEKVEGNEILGEFNGEEMMGIEGKKRNERRKERNRGNLESVYVEKKESGMKIGEEMVKKVIENEERNVVVIEERVVEKKGEEKRIYYELGLKK